MSRLDRRLLTAGINLTVTQLVTIWADHTPAELPVPLACPTCGHAYSHTAPLCPSAAVVRPLLRRRRHETGPRVLAPLTANQLADLTGKRLSTALPSEVNR
ncbi:hypothetical protein ACN27G_34855 [Plantactinospora sp. WMMB334]|uniref:hypothetical protein n=1 Tax=Plantactinospora sp. WMMB334 TaxID=3404119 RepID=UPI003B9418BB